MTILVIADDDSVLRSIPNAAADLLISCGDLQDEIIVQAAAKCGASEILAVKGNHDPSGPFVQPIRDLHGKTFTFKGITFAGFCGSWKYKPKGNYLFEQPEVEKAMAGIPPVDIFVAHNSPRLIHDREDDVHLGFVAFSSYIERAHPKLFLHGHQHLNQESVAGRTRIIGTFGHRFLVVPD